MFAIDAVAVAVGLLLFLDERGNLIKPHKVQLVVPNKLLRAVRRSLVPNRYHPVVQHPKHHQGAIGVRMRQVYLLLSHDPSRAKVDPMAPPGCNRVGQRC